MIQLDPLGTLHASYFWTYNSYSVQKVAHLHWAMHYLRTNKYRETTEESQSSHTQLFYMDLKLHFCHYVADLLSNFYTDLPGVHCLCLEGELPPLKSAKMLLWSIASDKTELLSPSASAVWMSRPCREPRELLKQDREENLHTETQTLGGTWHQHCTWNTICSMGRLGTWAQTNTQVQHKTSIARLNSDSGTCTTVVYYTYVSLLGELL